MDQTTDTSLILSRVFKVSPEELWDIWTDPEKINQWHRQTKDGETRAKADVQVGGTYQIVMNEEGSTYIVGGVFKELDPPHKLVYSWKWAQGLQEAESEVLVEFKPVPEGTELVLKHVRLSGPESVAAHKTGWINCFDNIDSLIAK